MSTKNPKITKKVAAPKPVRKSTPKKAPAGKKEEVKMIEEEAEDDVSLNDEEDDEYDQEDPEDDKFIANDDEVMLEEKMAKRALKREKLKKKKTYTEDDYGVDQDDLELINENRAANSKHRRLRQIQDEDSSEGAVPLTRGLSSEKPKNRIRALDDEDDGQDEEYEEPLQVGEEKVLEEAKPKVMSAEDKLAFDEVFGDPKDMLIAEIDIPERLQLKLMQTPMTDEELMKEAEWIFNLIIGELKYNQNLDKFGEIKSKIFKVLKMFKKDKIDIPFINRYGRAELIPELEQKDVWRIFGLDIEYGKLQEQKQKVLDFFNGLNEFAQGNNELDSFTHYKSQIISTQNLRDLNSFQPLMAFYRSYYQKEIEQKTLKQIQNTSGKKAPVPRRDFIFNARQKKMDEFSRRCMLLPVHLAQNLQAKTLLHKPPQPQNLGPLDMAREYPGTDHVDIVREMCHFTAAEIQCQPEVRQGFKQSVYQNGFLVTEPTEQGANELDVCHPCYRVKRVHKKLSELYKTDLFLDILNNEAQGLIKYSIIIKDIQDKNEEDEASGKPSKKININYAYLRDVFEMYQPADDQSKWAIPRRELFGMLSGAIQGLPGKSFLDSIVDEIKMELKEDAENFIVQECSKKYQDLVQMGYFKIDRKVNSSVEKIPQRVRLNVMGAYMTPIDARNYSATLVIVDQYGELVSQREFSHIIPPRESRNLPNGERAPMRPQEREELEKHQYERTEFQTLIKQHQVDLIVVAADCLEAKKLRKGLSDLTSSKNFDSQRSQEFQKDIFTIHGRPEVAKLFAESHNSQKLLKNYSLIVKKAVSLARFEQDPMNEVLNLWSPIQSENAALSLNLHPMQRHVHQGKLVDALEEINIKIVNRIGIDINLLVEHEHWHNQLQFLSGLGPRKAMIYIQKLKVIRKPIPSRAAIYSEGILGKLCFLSSSGFTKVRNPSDKNKPIDSLQYNSLDQTRIHPRNYESVYQLVTDVLGDGSEGPDKGKKIVNELIADPEKLTALAKGEEIRQEIKKIDQAGLSELVGQMIEDLMRPFMDFREQQGIVRGPDDSGFPGKELFYCLINETERTFKAGLIIQATVVRKYDSFSGNQQAKLLVRLENGLDANIYENDADFKQFRSIQEGNVITGRVKFSDEDNFSVNLVCKRERLRRHDMYIEELGLQDVPEEDMVNHAFKAEEEDQDHPRQKIISGVSGKPLVGKRNIDHPRFHNIASKAAVELLRLADIGEFCFRPSSRGFDHLSCTWKFYENNIVHLDIVEHNKAPGAQIGSKLTISDDSFENLQEIVERYITPCNRSLREVLQHSKFMKCKVLEEVQKVLEVEKGEESAKIPYKFTVVETYPQYVVLGYIPRNTMIKELIKVKARGYFFHGQFFSNLNELINWFKKEFRTPDYQRYLKKTPMPQLLGTAPIAPPQPYPMIVPDVMEVDQIVQQPRDDYDPEPISRPTYGRGQRANPDSNIRKRPYSPQNRSRSSSGDRFRNRSRSDSRGNRGYNKRSRSPDGYRPPIGRGYGRGTRGMAPDRNRDDRGGNGGGMGGGGGEKTCWNCNQSGHFSRECPEPKKERQGDRNDRGDRGDRRDNYQGQAKRQRMNDEAEGGSFRGTLLGSRWEQSAVDTFRQAPVHDDNSRQINSGGWNQQDIAPTQNVQPPRLPQMGPTPGANNN